LIVSSLLCIYKQRMLIDKLGLKPNEECIKEFYLSVHDWIAKIYKKNIPLKFITYTTIKMIKDINSGINT